MGLGADYGVIAIGSYNFLAHEITLDRDLGGDTLTVEYRCLDGNMRGNLLVTAGGWSTEEAFRNLKQTLDSMIGRK
jgi:hypothetical protein